MLRLDNVRIWDTGERIDLIVGGAEGDRFLAEPGAVVGGEVDASNLTLAPGLADPHVHFRDPGRTDKETMLTGAQAAAAGGYTNVLIMPNTEPAADGVSGALDYLDHYEKIHGVRLPVDYRLSICASVGREGLEPTSAVQIQRCAGMDHPVVAITDDGSAIMPEILDDVLDAAQSTGLPVLEHCEHHEGGVINDGVVSRELGVPGVPSSTELDIIERDIGVVRRTGVHIHFQHVSTAAGFAAVRQAKADGLPVTCETAPHYLALCDEDVPRYGAMAKMNPPLRSRTDREAALSAVADGTVDMIATDHAPHTVAEKERGLLDAPNGIIGLETAYGVCHKVLVDGGVIDERRLIELMAIAPARLMRCASADITALVEREGVVSKSPEGRHDGRRVLDLAYENNCSHINLTLLDQRIWWTVDPERFHSKARNTPFAGWDLTGLPMATILGGCLTFSRIPQDLKNPGKDKRWTV